MLSIILASSTLSFLLFCCKVAKDSEHGKRHFKVHAERRVAAAKAETRKHARLKFPDPQYRAKVILGHCTGETGSRHPEHILESTGERCRRKHDRRYKVGWHDFEDSPDAESSRTWETRQGLLRWVQRQEHADLIAEYCDAHQLAIEDEDDEDYACEWTDDTQSGESSDDESDATESTRGTASDMDVDDGLSDASA